MTAVNVRAASDADCGNWNDFVEQCPTASFFHLFEWRDIIDRKSTRLNSSH